DRVVRIEAVRELEIVGDAVAVAIAADRDLDQDGAEDRLVEGRDQRPAAAQRGDQAVVADGRDPRVAGLVGRAEGGGADVGRRAAGEGRGDRELDGLAGGVEL